MTTAERHRRCAELLPAYAMGAADPEERREVEAHLPECPECRAELERWHGVTEELATSPPPVAPAAGTREELLARIAGERWEPGQPRDRGAWPRTAGRRAAWIAAGVAAAVALAVLGWSLAAQSRLRTGLGALEGQVARLEAELARARGDLRSARSGLARTEAALALLASVPPGGEVVLAGLEPAPGGRARLYVDRAARRAVLVAGNLPALPEDRVYQLWTLTGGTPRSAGVFEAEAGGTALFLVDDVPAEAPDAWAVTVEPAGGVPLPTGPMVLTS